MEGCGVVEFENSQDAEKAIQELNDQELLGRRVFVREVDITNGRTEKNPNLEEIATLYREILEETAVEIQEILTSKETHIRKETTTETIIGTATGTTGITETRVDLIGTAVTTTGAIIGIAETAEITETTETAEICGTIEVCLTIETSEELQMEPASSLLEMYFDK